MRFVWVWLGIVNVIAFFITCFDKSAAKKGAWRVPERTLLLIAASGGSAAMFLAMRLIRHKTRKPKFMLLLPLLCLLQAAAVFLIYRSFF